MSSSHTTAFRVSKQGQKQSPKTTMLPRAVQNKLRMCVALRGYSTIRAGEGKTLTQQYKYMEDFFHGESNHSPSQVQMLVDGQLHYGALYKKKTAPISSKKQKKRRRIHQFSTSSNNHYLVIAVGNLFSMLTLLWMIWKKTSYWEGNFTR
jgi:hypothetical protein